MAPRPQGSFATKQEVGSFFAELVAERFSGFVDLDFGGRKRRVFCEGGRALSVQSTVAGENLCDHLVAGSKLTAEQRQQAMTLAKERKAPLESVLVSEGLASDAVVRSALAELCRVLIKRCLDETSGSYQATEKAGLGQKLSASPVDLAQILAAANVSIVRKAPPDSKVPELYDMLARIEGKGHYDVLGVAEGASADEIKKRYFELAKKWHSDRFSGIALGPRDKEGLEELFGKISDAHNLLGDEAKRKEYDAFLERKRKGLPTDMNAIVEAEARFKLGESLLRRGDHEGALRELSEATRINAGEAEFWAAYGLALYLAKGPSTLKEAVLAIQKALTMMPKLAKGHEYLGRIYRGEGDLAKAKTQFNRCLELDGKNVAAQRELRLMNMREGSGKVEPVKAQGLLAKLFKK